jgi:hypothetical protein
MTAKEKAAEGIRLLKEAIVEYHQMHPGRKSTEVRDELGLHAPNKKGDWGDGILWGIENLLEVEGLLERRKVRGRNICFLVEKPKHN